MKNKTRENKIHVHAFAVLAQGKIYEIFLYEDNLKHYLDSAVGRLQSAMGYTTTPIEITYDK